MSIVACALLATHLTATADRSEYPRIAMLWSAHDGPGSVLDKAPKYDFVLVGPGILGLEYEKNPYPDLATQIVPSTFATARQTLSQMRQKSPHATVITENYFYEANNGAYPEDSPWWFRDANGKRVQFWEGCFNMKVDHPEYIEHIGKRIEAIAAATDGKAGLYLDNLRFEPEAKNGWDALLANLRTKRPDRFIMVNAGWASTDLEWIAPKINGVMYEDSIHHTEDGDQEAFYARVGKFDKLMMKPTRSVVEVWGKRDDQERAIKELVRTCLYTDAAYLYADSTFGHRHTWRGEWDEKLGTAIDPAKTPDGTAQIRRFSRGVVGWNPSKDTALVQLHEMYRDVRTGKRSNRLRLAPGQFVYLVKSSRVD